MPVGRKRGTRFSDIARAAGVGIATVDRVMNERGNVSAGTAAKVLEAARFLGTNRTLPQPWQRHRRYRAIFSRQRVSVANRLNEAFRKISAALGGTITLERNFVDRDDPASLTDEILRCEGQFDGLIVMPIDDPRVRRAVQKVSLGMPVVTIVSDIRDSGRQWFVGIDNYRAGRTATCLCRRVVGSEGAIGVLWRGKGYTGQAERIRGVQAVATESGDEATVLIHAIESDDDALLVSSATRFLRANPSLTGLYNAGLREAPIAEAVVATRDPESFCYVGHELTPTNSRLLGLGILDFVIDQNPEQQAQCALDRLLSNDRLINEEHVEQIPEFSIYCAENLTREFRVA